MSRIGSKMIGDADDGHIYPYDQPFSQIVLQYIDVKTRFIRQHSTVV